jgi:sugar-specific transcriptional regulator TrmB
MIDIDADVDLEEEYKKVLRTLKSIGLSDYEGKTYIALVAHGVGDAETIASTAKIPRTSSYKALQSLCKKEPETPERVKGMLIKDVEETFDKLALIHEMLGEKGEPQLVYTVMGKSKVIEKIGELLDKSVKTFMIATPSFSDIKGGLAKKLDAASNRGIKIVLIMDPLQKPFKGRNVEVIKKKGLIATDVISDGERALIASHDLSACGYTDNASLAEHLESFLKILMVH